MSIILWEVLDFVVDQQIRREIDTSTGELSIHFEGAGSHLGKLPLLFKEDGSSIRVANIWLIHLKANLRKKEVNTQAQGLLHYFTFLKDVNMEWDEMPIAVRLRPTYQFKKHLRNSYSSGILARSTANNYMRVVINFYKFYLSRNHFFEYPPFKYEMVKVDKGSSHQYMRDFYFYVDSTDLRLRLPSEASYYGLPRKLLPLNENEWSLVRKYYSVFKKGISNRAGGEEFVPVSEEFQIAIELGRFSGLRREEITTLRLSSIYKPSAEQLKRKYLIHTEGLLLDPKLGVETKNSSVRRAEIPTELMQRLHRYVNSKRYIKRRDLYASRHPDEKSNPPLLINQKGDIYSPLTINARWGELRNAVKCDLKGFEHKFHNLRSTYAVERLKELLNQGINEGKALDYLQSTMGHKNRSTLLGYLKFCEDKVIANEVYESALDIVLSGEK